MTDSHLTAFELGQGRGDTPTDPAMTVQDLAGIGYDGMERATRDDGSEYTRRKDDAPDWLTDLVHEAHGDMLPDDYRYSIIHEALGAIHDASGDLDDAGTEFADDADVYNADLLRWVGSRSDRAEYVDEARAEFGEPRDFYHSLQMGQYIERGEVYRLVLAFLVGLSMADEDED